MLTTTVAGRTWHFSKAIGRNAAAGNGFSQPIDVALAPDGALYVVSRGQEGAGIGGVQAENKRLGKVTMDDQLLGDFGRRELTWPACIAVDKAGMVYCSDEHENIIAIYDADGQRQGQWGTTGSAEGQLDGPSGLAFDAEDNLFVVDTRNDRVQKFTRDGTFISAFGSTGSAEGQFNRPWGITIDSSGDLYVVDWGNSRVQKFTAGGTHLATFGNDPGGELNHPADVAVDSDGDVYVTDWGNKRVQIYGPDTLVITALYGDAMEFSAWAKEVIDSNPDAAAAYRRVKDKTELGLFNRPVGIVVDSQGRIVITDSTRGRLQVYEKQKGYLDPQFNL